MSFKQEDRLQVAVISGLPSSEDAFVTGQILTNLSAELKRVWAIWRLEFFYPYDGTDAVAAASEFIATMQITKSVQSGLLNHDNTDLIHSMETIIARNIAIGTDAGPMWYVKESPQTVWFPQPIAFAAPAMNVSFKTLNVTVVNLITARIYYTVRSVSSQEFLEIQACR